MELGNLASLKVIIVALLNEEISRPGILNQETHLIRILKKSNNLIEIDKL